MKAAALRKVQAENDEWDATAEERFYRGSPLLKNRVCYGLLNNLQTANSCIAKTEACVYTWGN